MYDGSYLLPNLVPLGVEILSGLSNILLTIGAVLNTSPNAPPAQSNAGIGSLRVLGSFLALTADTLFLLSIPVVNPGVDLGIECMSSSNLNLLKSISPPFLKIF